MATGYAAARVPLVFFQRTSNLVDCLKKASPAYSRGHQNVTDSSDPTHPRPPLLPRDIQKKRTFVREVLPCKARRCRPRAWQQV